MLKSKLIVCLALVLSGGLAAVSACRGQQIHFE